MMTMDWDSPIDSNEAGSSFEVLPPGKCSFTVTAFTRATVKNGDMTGANMAKLELRLNDGDRTGKAFENLILHKKTLWKVAQFAVAAGLLKKGDNGAIPWNRVPGASGMCEIKVEDYVKDGETRKKNVVVKFIEQSEIPF